MLLWVHIYDGREIPCDFIIYIIPDTNVIEFENFSY